eukprot:TRINITY_DN22706_c4_g1_i1.p1 TRINITY_DN22706_c4_g1~~TRINITY_DN22706_c4_g1_i1.p1  ORF type:complete len:242 (-),score=53.51 TRINITY_DN22706_c4_g1_i1:79-804(-)
MESHAQSASSFEPRDLLGADEAAARDALRELEAQGQIPAGKSADIEQKAFSDCNYLSCKALGIQLRLTPASNGKVDVVFLYNEGVDGFSEFKAAKLPEGLEWTHLSRDVVTILGEPSDKYGGNRLPVGISYETLGLDISFKGKNWDDSQNELGFVSLFPQLAPTHGLCAVCGKLASFRCSLCKTERYCSSRCQKADWNKHQLVCSGASTAKKAIGNDNSLGSDGPRLDEDKPSEVVLESMD